MRMKDGKYLHWGKWHAKIKMRPTSHREVVRFGKEKHETWLGQWAAAAIFTKIHMTRVCHFIIFLPQRWRLPHKSTNTWIHKKNKELKQYNFDRIKEQRNNLSLLVGYRGITVGFQWCRSLTPSLWKWQRTSCSSMRFNTFDPQQLKCTLVQNTNLAIASS